MFKKIMVAVALSAGLAGTVSALTPEELDAVLNTPEAQAKIKKQVAALIQKGGVPAVGAADTVQLAMACQNALHLQNLQILERVNAQLNKKDAKPTFWKSCVTKARSLYSNVAAHCIGYGGIALLLLELARRSTESVPFGIGKLILKYAGDPLFGEFMSCAPALLLVMMLIQIGLTQLEENL